MTYTVPAGSYSSSVSQADADQRAQNDVNTNGQAYANYAGSCPISTTDVTLSNNSTGTFHIYFSSRDNAANNKNFTINGSQSAIYTLKSGNYEITINPDDMYSTEQHYFSAPFGSITGTSATFSNISISSIYGIQIDID